MRVQVDAHTKVQIDATAKRVDVMSPWQKDLPLILIEERRLWDGSLVCVTLKLFGKVTVRPDPNGVVIVITEENKP